MSTREDVYSALFALIGGITWGVPARSFQYKSRRVKLWSDVPAQPAICQAEHGETVEQTTNMPQKRTLRASWLIYHSVGKDPAAVPATEDNLILDSIEALFRAETPEEVQTLDGLVHYARISGQVFKDPGDLDGQALIIIPIEILWP